MAPSIDVGRITTQIIALIVGLVVSMSVSLVPPPKGPSPTPPPMNTTSTPQQVPPSPSPTRQIILPTRYDNGRPWGEAWRQDDGSYTLKIVEDPAMSTPRELADAINTYRETKGVGRLEWSDTLAQYAQYRADYVAEHGSDHHEGFNSFVQNEGGYDKLGFYCLGENMSEGFRLTGTHLVEWMYAQSPGHDANQLNSIFSRIGVGISGTVSVIIFGGCY